MDHESGGGLGGARVLTRRAIDQRAVVRRSDAFYGMPGVRVSRRSIHSTRPVARANRTLSVYVGGFRRGTDIDAVPPAWVEVAEVYWGLGTPVGSTGLNGTVAERSSSGPGWDRRGRTAGRATTPVDRQRGR